VEIVAPDSAKPFHHLEQFLPELEDDHRINVTAASDCPWEAVLFLASKRRDLFDAVQKLRRAERNRMKSNEKNSDEVSVVIDFMNLIFASNDTFLCTFLHLLSEGYLEVLNSPPPLLEFFQDIYDSFGYFSEIARRPDYSTFVSQETNRSIEFTVFRSFRYGIYSQL
jgi:hypothetical protein